MPVIKVFCAATNECRRFNLPEESEQLFALLSKSVTESFGLAGQDFRITYLDDEGDRCIVGGNDELREAIRFFKSSPVKLTIEQLIKAIAPPEAPEAPSSAASPSESTPEVAPTAVEEAAVVNPEPLESKEDVEPVAEPVAEPVVEAPVLPSVEFVRDVTLPDGSVHRCGAHVQKIWEVKNSGETAWPENCKLILCKEKEKENKTRIRFNKDQPILLPALPPGATTEIAVDLKLPCKNREGAHKIFFQLVTPDNTRFSGDYLLFADLKVEAPLPALTKQQFLRTLPIFIQPPELNGAVDEEVRAAMASLLEQHPAVPVHTNIRCDGCDQFPLKGPRFNCTVCPDFDLCESCEAKGIHPIDHPLMKLQTARLPHHHHHPFGRFGHFHRGHHGFHGPHGPHGRGPLSHWLHRLSEVLQPAAPASASPEASPEEEVEVPAVPSRKDVRKWSRKGKGSTKASRKALRSRGKDSKEPHARAEFVQDVNLPDGASVPFGTFTKTWAFKNSGRATWLPGTTLICVDKNPQVSVSNASVPLAQPGEVVEVSVDVTPLAPGRVLSYFRLFNPAAAEGERRFGPRVWLDLEVTSTESAAFALPLFSSAAAEPAPASSASSSAPAQPSPFGLPLLNTISALFTPVPTSAATVPTVVATPVAAAAAAAVEPTPAPAPQPEASAPKPSAPPAPVVPAFLILPADEAYPNELRQLHALGFTDLDSLRSLLLAANGNVQRVVNWLLSQ